MKLHFVEVDYSGLKANLEHLAKQGVPFAQVLVVTRHKEDSSGAAGYTIFWTWPE